MKIWAVRHAQPLIAPGVCYGHLDVFADADATRLVAQDLAVSLPPSTSVYFSPLARCAVLAKALNALRLDLEFFEDARLKEMNFGAWEGQRWSEIDPEELRAWTDDFAHYAPANAESIYDFVDRVRNARDDCVASAFDAPVVWLTHAGVIRALSVMAEQEEGVASATRRLNYQAAKWPSDPIPFGSLTRFEFTLSPKA